MQRGTEREARERKTKKDEDRKQLATDVIHSCLLPTGNPLMPIASLQRHNLHPGMSMQGCFACVKNFKGDFCRALAATRNE